MYKTGEQIAFWARLKPDAIAFGDESHEVSFLELDTYTKQIAYVLREEGIKRGDLVATILPPYVGWLFTFALYRLGVTTMSKNNLTAFSPSATPDWLITLEAHPNIPANRTILFDEKYLEKVNASKELEIEIGFESLNSPAALFATSGTTGEAKYVMATAEELRLIATRPGTDDSFGQDDVLSLLPFGAAWSSFHAVKCLTLGKPFFSCSFTDYRLPKVLNKYPVRTMIGSPAQISSFLEVQLQTGTKLPLLKSILIGGSVPSQQLIDRVKAQVDCTIYNTYGSTEAGHVTIYEIKDAKSAGAWVRPPVTLQIVDENHQILPPHAVGQVRYQRPDMSKGYYKNAAATAEFFRDGFFYPGDRGYLDEHGRLFLDGRGNEVINLGGVKLNPEIVDDIAMAQLGVVDCASFAFVDEAGVERLAIAVVANSDFDSENFGKAMTKKSPHIPRYYIPVEKIPRNASGKVLRHELRADFEAKNLTTLNNKIRS